MGEAIGDGSNGHSPISWTLIERPTRPWPMEGPAAHRHQGEQTAAMVQVRYARDVTLAGIIQWFERSLAGNLP